MKDRPSLLEEERHFDEFFLFFGDPGKDLVWFSMFFMFFLHFLGSLDPWPVERDSIFRHGAANGKAQDFTITALSWEDIACEKVMTSKNPLK